MEVEKLLLPHGIIEVPKVPGNVVVQDDPPGGRFQPLAVHLHLHLGLVVHAFGVHGEDALVQGGEVLPFPLGSRPFARKVVDPENHVLRGNGNGVAAGGVEEVLR